MGKIFGPAHECHPQGRVDEWTDLPDTTASSLLNLVRDTWCLIMLRGKSAVQYKYCSERVWVQQNKRQTNYGYPVILLLAISQLLDPTGSLRRFHSTQGQTSSWFACELCQLTCMSADQPRLCRHGISHYTHCFSTVYSMVYTCYSIKPYPKNTACLTNISVLDCKVSLKYCNIRYIHVL